MAAQASEGERGPLGAGGAPAAARSRAPALACALLAALAVLLWVLPSDRVLAYHVFTALGIARRAPAGPRPPSPAPTPAPVGLALPHGGAGSWLRQARGLPQRACLLVAVGDCGGCISADLRAWRRSARAKGIAFVVLTTASPADAARTMRTSGIEGAVVVSDPGGKVSAWLNAGWPARPYLFDPGWRLLWAAPAPAPGYDPFRDRPFLAALEGARR